MALEWRQKLGRAWNWAMLVVNGGGALIAFRLAYTFWETADEDNNGAIWYTVCAVAIVGGVFLLWQAVIYIRRLRSSP